jgi:hypothetical protein
MTTVAVFMDWQNVYRAARDAFELRQASPARGNFDPLAVSRYLAAVNKRGNQGRLVRVEIHRGLPPPNTNPKGHGAADRQRQAWEALDPELVAVKLRGGRRPEARKSPYANTRPCALSRPTTTRV